LSSFTHCGQACSIRRSTSMAARYGRSQQLKLVQMAYAEAIPMDVLRTEQHTK
jgi:hypothetical protein